MQFSRLKEFINTLKIEGLNDEEVFNLIAKRLEPKFELNNNNTEVFNQLKYYFSNNSKFDGDLKKGILLIGGFGSGKTLAMEIFLIYNIMLNRHRTMAFFNSSEIIDEFTKLGRPSIEQFNKDYDVLIDDLGSDSGKYYYFGSIDDPIEVLLSKRYIMFKDFGSRTHGISNLDVHGFKERFSCKMYDRMCEMFNVIALVGESWRRK
jgi:DNA replication protein DnaC